METANIELMIQWEVKVNTEDSKIVINEKAQKVISFHREK